MNRIAETLFATVLMAASAIALAQADAPMVDIELVPHPDPEQLDPAVSEVLQPAVDYFRQQRATLQGRSLGLAYGRMGINYLAHEQQEPAAACLRNAGALDPGNARWPYLLGYSYQQSGFLDKARDSYRDALKIDPGYLPGFIRLGRVLLELDSLDEAQASFEVVLQANSDNAAAVAGMGRIAFHREDYPRAASLFQRALRLDPEASSLHYRLGQTYRALGEADKAQAELDRAGEQAPAIEDPLLAFVEAHTRGAGHYLEAAAKAEEMGSPAVALKFYDIATSIDPSNVDALLRLGELQGGAGDSDAALRAFGRVLSIEPDNAKANYYVGTLLEQRGDEIQAREYYSKALEKEPQLVEPRMLLANSLMRAREFSQAGDNYSQIAHQLPSSVEVLYLLGMAWLAAGECQWAHPVLLQAFRLAPGDGPTLTALGRAYSTCDDATDEQRAQALETTRAMYDRDPSQQTAETLAMASAASGLFEEAVDYQAQAIFEALKQNDTSVERYKAGQPAQDPWSLDAQVYRPRPLMATSGGLPAAR
jgi:tetratricopeptide (TPR) repeat protein